MSGSDAGPQEPIGFALRIAVDSSALLCELANNSCLRLTRGDGQVLTLRSDTYSRSSGSPQVTEDNWQCRPPGLGLLLVVWAPRQGLRAVSVDG